MKYIFLMCATLYSFYVRYSDDIVFTNWLVKREKYTK